MSKSVLDKNVSLFKSLMEPSPVGEINLVDWLNSSEFESEVKLCRKYKTKEKKRTQKKQLPAITPSGIFHPVRNADNLIEHSGLICIDIDSGDNPQINDWENLKTWLSNIPNIAYCGLSVSGKGAFAILPIAYPRHHVFHFNAIEHFMKNEGINIDVACKDVCRLRTISFDPSAYFNHQAELLQTYEGFDKDVMKKALPKISDDDIGTIESILEEIKSLSIDITDGYNEWFQIACAISKVYGEEGRKKFHEFSQFSPKYNAKECNRQYDACLKKEYGYGVGTLIYIRNQYR